MDKKVLSELNAKMQESVSLKTCSFNQPKSEKVTLYNEMLQKTKLLLKKFQPKTPLKTPLSEIGVLNVPEPKNYSKNH